MKDVEGQVELALVRRANSVQVPVEMIRSKRTAGAAFTLACDASGLEDKEICSALGVDKATFSRMKNGTNTLDADLIHKFCSIVRNTIYVDWVAYQVGCGLVLLKSELERRLDEMQIALQKSREREELMRDLLQGKAN